MNYFFITGTSKGLGKALTELLLENPENFVYGFSRNTTIQHPNYLHYAIDLTNTEHVKSYTFPKIDPTKRVVLINNAGTLGDVDHIGNINPDDIVNAFTINLITPALLSNTFISAYQALNTKKMIINISSGAGKTPIDGWNVYCASKAGLDMFSQVAQEESNIDTSDIKILSLAPGIIDTDMQSTIRNSDEKGFSNLNRFIEYKKEGELSSPTETAKKVIQFINNPELAQHTVCSVRDI